MNLPHFRVRSWIGLLLAISISTAVVLFLPVYFTNQAQGDHFSRINFSIAHADDGGGGGDSGGAAGDGGGGGVGDAGCCGGDSSGAPGDAGAGCCGGDSSGSGVGDAGGGFVFFNPPPPPTPLCPPGSDRYGGGRCVTPPPPAPRPSCTIKAEPSLIYVNQDPILSWTWQNATSASIDQGIGPVTVNGTYSVFPSVTTTYTMTVSGPGGTATCQTTVQVEPSPAPDCNLMADDNTIYPGQVATLSWNSVNSTSASLDHGIGPVPVQGSRSVSPTQSTVYRLSVWGPQGSSWCTTNVNVTQTQPQWYQAQQQAPQQQAPQQPTQQPQSYTPPQPQPQYQQPQQNYGQNDWYRSWWHNLRNQNPAQQYGGVSYSDRRGAYAELTPQQNTGWMRFMQLRGMQQY